ncbi:MAG: CDP-alcohol phosphatidyltransferase family protein [Planctomycetota bacterium]|jgi:phosphatidylglycerophosphate synthase
MIERVPNGLSIVRLLLAVVLPWLAPGWRLAAVVVAAVTDLLDGFLARRFGVTSVAGGLLDGIADKLFVLSAVLTLTLDGPLAGWQAPLVILRDLVVALIVLYAFTRQDLSVFRRMPPRVMGKVTTAAQFALFVVVLAPWPAALGPALAVTIACSVVAGADYLWQLGLALRAERRETAE